jgi:hypothetical protein
MSFDKNPEPFLKCLPADQPGKDPRATILAFVESFYQWYNKLSDENKPNRLQVSRSSYVDDSTDTITRSYSFTIETAAASLNVLEEKANEE